MGSQLLYCLIYREAWGIGRDLKKDAIRFAKVHRVEVLAVHHRRDIEVETTGDYWSRLRVRRCSSPGKHRRGFPAVQSVVEEVQPVIYVLALDRFLILTDEQL